MIDPAITREEVESFLRSKHIRPFYSDNYWIRQGESDYSGKTLCEYYCREKFPEVPPQELFKLTMELEYILNRESRLAVLGRKTYEYREDLKTIFGAKWDPQIKKWYVSAEKIKDPSFHDYCYSPERNFQFKWLLS